MIDVSTIEFDEKHFSQKYFYSGDIVSAKISELLCS
jgi:hypothetical protein